MHKNENVIYLARPCQFEWSNNCNKDTWTLSQYSTSVLSGYKSIIEELSEKYEEIHLVGYSGGAGIAMYLGSINNKSVKSIIGKLSREGVYRKQVYKTKSGEVPVTKEQLISGLAELFEIDSSKLMGLEKAPKQVIKYLHDTIGGIDGRS